MIKKTDKLFENAHVQVFSKKLLECGRLNEHAFTRKRNLGFIDIIGVLLNFNNHTLQTELNNFFEHVLEMEDNMISKQAFSKARQNLNPNVFRYLSDSLVQTFYGDGEFDCINNYRILAVDGTCIELPNTEKLRDAYGHVGDQSQTVRAYASALFDIVNQVIIASELDRYRTDERTFAKRHLTKLKTFGYKNELILYDRGYPSREMLAYHFDEGLQFLMRCKDSFLDKKRIFRSERDEMIDFKSEDRDYTVRRVQFKLPSGETETLVTSLTEESLEDLKRIYALRWGIETEYHVLKHVLQIENFSGYNPLSIQQDFYATIYLSNLAAGFLYDSRHVEDKDSGTQERKTKYEYKVNRNELYGSLKNDLFKVVIMPNPVDRVKILEKIRRKMKMNMVPIRPDRHPKRGDTRRTGIKYPTNQRKSL